MSWRCSVAQILDKLGGELRGDPKQLVHRIAPLSIAGPGDISFLAHARYRSQLDYCKAQCVILTPAEAAQASHFASIIVTDNPYLYYARLSQWVADENAHPPEPGVSDHAVVSPRCKLGKHVSIAALSVIEEGAILGDHVVIGAGCFVGRDVRIGDFSKLAPRVTVLDGSVVGARCLFHSGAVIGSDGFGFARDANKHGIKIAQLGIVRIGDDVEIGANTTIDRAALQETVIGNGVKIDNQVQIGHNVQIGEHTALAGCVGVAGSAEIGAYCFIGGSAGILGPLRICIE